jgi:hypothetical protein
LPQQPLEAGSGGAVAAFCPQALLVHLRIDVGVQRVPECASQVALARPDEPARLEHPPQLAQRPGLVAEVLQHCVAEHDVKGAVRVAELVYAPALEAEV